MTTTTTNLSTRVVPVGGGEIAVDESGAGPGLLVLHHEIGSPGWTEFYDELARGRTVAVPDLPGYGRSTRPEWARSPARTSPIRLWVQRRWTTLHGGTPRWRRWRRSLRDGRISNIGSFW